MVDGDIHKFASDFPMGSTLRAVLCYVFAQYYKLYYFILVFIYDIVNTYTYNIQLYTRE